MLVFRYHFRWKLEENLATLVYRVSVNWLIKSQGTKFRKMDKFLKRTFEICNNEQENVFSTSNVVKKQKIVKRQYREDYIPYEFLLVL